MILKTNKKYEYMLKYIDSEKYPINLYGYQCNKGWYELINKMIETIYYLDVNKDIRIYQIKEKFGEFRFYYNSHNISNKHIADIVNKYTTLINTTCELCGKPGTLQRNGYFQTLCKACIELKD